MIVPIELLENFCLDYQIKSIRKSTHSGTNATNLKMNMNRPIQAEKYFRLNQHGLYF